MNLKKSLFLAAFVASTSRVRADLDDISSFVKRDLQAIPCNVPFETLGLAEIQAALTSVFEFKLGSGVTNASSIIDNKIPLTEYDVQLIKVCSSCASQNLNGYGCNEDDYGYNTTHSGLVLIPVVKDSSLGPYPVINAKRLKPWFQFGGVTISPVDNFKQVYQLGFNNFEFALLSASCGHVSFIMSKTGYEEAGSLIMSDINRKSAVTMTIPLYYKAGEIIEAMSDGKTKLSKRAVFTGYSGGGYAAAAAADGMKAYDMIPIQLLAGGAPFKTKSWLLIGFYRSLFADTLSPIAPFTTALSGLAFSGTREDVANYPNQSFLKPDKVGRLTDLFKDYSAPSLYENGATNYLSYLQANYMDLLADPSFIDPDLEAFFKDATLNEDEDPCLTSGGVPANVTKNCDSLVANDLEEVLTEADYPIDLCHSKQDEFVAYENTVESLTTYQLEGLGHGPAYSFCSVALYNGYTIKKPKLRETKAPTKLKSKKPTTGPSTSKPTKSPKGSKKKKAKRG